jgi:hypothetical protein
VRRADRCLIVVDVAVLDGHVPADVHPVHAAVNVDVVERGAATLDAGVLVASLAVDLGVLDECAGAFETQDVSVVARRVVVRERTQLNVTFGAVTVTVPEMSMFEYVAPGVLAVKPDWCASAGQPASPALVASG